MKPNILYRGIVLTNEQIKNEQWYNSDIHVPYDPLIDEYGRKVVKDGNEYGVYMTDNLEMVLTAYGNPTRTGD